MEIIGCKNCGKEHIPMDEISVNVIFMKHSWCKECYQTNTVKQEYFFCSPDCFQKYIKNNVLEWDSK
jgi:hypothetical protein